MNVIRTSGDIRNEVRRENAIAQSEKNQALIDYIAIMADIELPSDSENEIGMEVE